MAGGHEVGVLVVVVVGVVVGVLVVVVVGVVVGSGVIDVVAVVNVCSTTERRNGSSQLEIN